MTIFTLGEPSGYISPKLVKDKVTKLPDNLESDFFEIDPKTNKPKREMHSYKGEGFYSILSKFGNDNPILVKIKETVTNVLLRVGGDVFPKKHILICQEDVTDNREDVLKHRQVNYQKVYIDYQAEPSVVYSTPYETRTFMLLPNEIEKCLSGIVKILNSPNGGYGKDFVKNFGIEALSFYFILKQKLELGILDLDLEKELIKESTDNYWKIAGICKNVTTDSETTSIVLCDQGFLNVLSTFILPFEIKYLGVTGNIYEEQLEEL